MRTPLLCHKHCGARASFSGSSTRTGCSRPAREPGRLWQAPRGTRGRCPVDAELEYQRFVTWRPCELLGRVAVRKRLFVGLPARSAGNFGLFCTIRRVPARSAGNFWAFYSVSGEIPARSAWKFWGICELFDNYSCSAVEVHACLLLRSQISPLCVVSEREKLKQLKHCCYQHCNKYEQRADQITL